MGTNVLDIPKLWIKEELKKQRKQLKLAEGAKQWQKVEAYQKYMRMMNEIVLICEKYANE
jgi:hypothetical protein